MLQFVGQLTPQCASSHSDGPGSSGCVRSGYMQRITLLCIIVNGTYLPNCWKGDEPVWEAFLYNLICDGTLFQSTFVFFLATIVIYYKREVARSSFATRSIKEEEIERVQEQKKGGREKTVNDDGEDEEE